MASKFPEAEKRMFKNVYVCYKCKTKIRTSYEKVKNKAVVKRILRMVEINEYKRRQSPPGIKITPRAFGKDRRMPITNRFVEFQ